MSIAIIRMPVKPDVKEILDSMYGPHLDLDRANVLGKFLYYALRDKRDLARKDLGNQYSELYPIHVKSEQAQNRGYMLDPSPQVVRDFNSFVMHELNTVLRSVRVAQPGFTVQQVIGAACSMLNLSNQDSVGYERVRRMFYRTSVLNPAKPDNRKSKKRGRKAIKIANLRNPKFPEINASNELPRKWT